MKRMTASQARQRMADLLDAAERGEEVLIERRGVRFRVSAERKPRPRPRNIPPLVEILDPAVERGQWTWKSDERGVVFAPRARRR